MPLPKPKRKEDRNDYVSRCIQSVMHEGTTDDTKQAAAMCYSTWRDSKKKKAKQ